jgi:mannosyltransferase
MSSSARYTCALMLLTFLAAIIRLLTMQNAGIWFDEAVSLLIAKNNIYHIITGSPGVSVNPPLYYILLHLWSWIAGGEIGARLLSVFFGLAAVIMAYLLALRLMGERIALLTALIFTVSPFQVYYSQELRMYSLLTFLSLGIMHSTIGVLQRDRIIDWIGLVLFSIAGLYTHYFTALVIAVSIGLIIVSTYRQRAIIMKAFIACIIIAALFAPWVPSFMNNTGEVYTAKSTAATEVHTNICPALFLLSTFKSFSIGNEQTISLVDYPRAYFIIIPACLIFILLFVLGMTGGLQRKKAIKMSMYIFVPIIITILISSKMMDVYLNRYLIICTGPFDLLVSRGLSLLTERRRLFAFLIIFLVGLSLTANFNRSLNPDYRREEFRQAALYVAQNACPGDRVSHPSIFTLYPFLEYNGQKTDEYLFLDKTTSSRVYGLIPYRTIVPADLAWGRIWWVMPITTGQIQSRMPWYNLTQQVYSSPLKMIKSKGFEEVERQDFKGIRVILLRKLEACQ